MEKEGLIRGLKYFEDNDLHIGLLVTDRHKQLSAWVRDNMPDIKHAYDVWHVAKCKLLHAWKLKVHSRYVYIQHFGRSW